MARTAGIICAAVGADVVATTTKPGREGKPSFGMTFSASGQYVNVPRLKADRDELVAACAAYDKIAGTDANLEYAVAVEAHRIGLRNITVTPGSRKPGQTGRDGIVQHAATASTKRQAGPDVTGSLDNVL